MNNANRQENFDYLNNQKIKIAISVFKKAYLTLKSGIEKGDLSDLERDGVIQRFEYTTELSRKTLKKILKYEGENDNLFAKEVFKKFYEKGILKDLIAFTKFLNFRNIFSHTYDLELSNDLFDFIKRNYLNFEVLIEDLEKRFCN